MAKARFVVGSSVKNEDILWATKFFAPDSFPFIEVDGKKIMVTNALEYGRAKKEAMVDEVLLDRDLETKHLELFAQNKGLYFMLFKEYGVSSIAVSPDFPAGIAKNLSDKGVQIEFQKPLFPERAIKTEWELTDIRRAQRAMEQCFRMLVEIIERSEIRDGKLWNGNEFITSEMLRCFFDSELLKLNCLAEATIIASGDEATDPHCLGYEYVLANTPIVCDMFPRSRKNWYWSDMTRTIVKGKLSDEARKMYQAVYETQMRACEMVKPGADFSEIHRFAKKNLKDVGFKTKQIDGEWQGFFHGIGHGVGLEIHEEPFPSQTREVILEPGNVITIEPGLYYKGVGGVRIEDTLVVTENGHENLARISKELIELP